MFKVYDWLYGFSKSFQKWVDAKVKADATRKMKNFYRNQKKEKQNNTTVST